MAFNDYNARSAGRFNTPGRFVTGGERAPGGSVGTGPRPRAQRHFGMNNIQRPNQFRPNQLHQQNLPQKYRQPMPQQNQQQELHPQQPMQMQPQQQPHQQLHQQLNQQLHKQLQQQLQQQPQEQPQPPPQSQPQLQQQPQQAPQPPSPPHQKPPIQLAQPSQKTNSQAMLLQSLDVEMKTEPSIPTKVAADSIPYWMKSKLVGVKKISNKERRRRQNESLRRLLAPKNALMVLNEMMSCERDVSGSKSIKKCKKQFKVEPTSFCAETNTSNFCAELTIDGVDYKGYGENKIAARNDAAEQAIRDLIIKRMMKANGSEAAAPPPADAANEDVKDGAGEESSAKAGAAAATGAGTGAVTGAVAGAVASAGASAEADDDAPLPMIQLASFALHKLFAEWEYDGHRVPQFKPSAGSAQGNDAQSEAGAAEGGRKKGPRALPLQASAMHPCMLLTHMRPHLEYRELAVDGDRPQNMIFTMGIDVDGVTYVGKAANKREARKMAARSACAALFGVTFNDEQSAPAPAAPQPAPPAPPPAAGDPAAL